MSRLRLKVAAAVLERFTTPGSQFLGAFLLVNRTGGLMKTVIPWMKQCLYWLLLPFLLLYTLLIRLPLWLLFSLCYPAGLRVLGLSRGQIAELQEEWDDWSKEEIDRDVF